MFTFCYDDTPSGGLLPTVKQEIRQINQIDLPYRNKIISQPIPKKVKKKRSLISRLFLP